MSITKSYNKYTDTYYAYETTYEWDEKAQKKVQRKRCIGQFDLDTGEVIPNGKVGRPSRMTLPKKDDQKSNQQNPTNTIDLTGLIDHCEKIDLKVSELCSEVRELKREIDRVKKSAY